MKRCEILIAGGGFAGLATAAACAARGMNVCLLEARSRPMSAFRGELLHPAGARLLPAIGLGDASSRALSVPVTGFAVFESAARPPVLLPYDARGGQGVAADHRRLLAAFRERLEREPRVRMLAGTPVAGLLGERGRVVGLRAIDGREFRADVVVIADGRFSRLRSQLGIGTRSVLLSYTVALELRGSALPHEQNGHVFLGAAGPVLAYRHGASELRLCVDVPLSAPHGRAALAAYLREGYAPHLPEPLRAGAIAELAGGRFELCANHAVTTDACAVPGSALVGDAAGCSHPLTATGMPTTLLDAVTLARRLDRGGSLDRQLAAYQRDHYRFARSRELFAQALYEIFRGAEPGARALQRGVFEYWRRDPRARTASIRILSGETSGALPFANQYARVLGVASAELVARALRSRELRYVSALGPMFAAAGSSLRSAAQHGVQALQSELFDRLAWPLKSAT